MSLSRFEVRCPVQYQIFFSVSRASSQLFLSFLKIFSTFETSILLKDVRKNTFDKFLVLNIMDNKMVLNLFRSSSNLKGCISLNFCQTSLCKAFSFKKIVNLTCVPPDTNQSHMHDAVCPLCSQLYSRQVQSSVPWVVWFQTDRMLLKCSSDQAQK